MTAGEATRHAIPGYVPYADSHGVYERGWQALHDAALETWMPYLAGKGTRDEALLGLMKKVGRP